MKVINVNNLSKFFGKVQALNNVSFDIEKGEIVGFIGPNGAGKSTTLNILLGLIKASSGSAKINDYDVWNHNLEIHKDIAYVPGDVNLWPNMKGIEVIDMLLKIQGPIDTKKRDNLIKIFELDINKRCKDYSKGNRQKVALIAAFASSASIFILDEPTSGLDPLMERKFQDELEKLKQEGKSVLLSSHILSEVEKVCDRVIIINKGKIVDDGSLSDLRYLTKSVFKIESRDPIDIYEFKNTSNFDKDGFRYSFEVDNKEVNKYLNIIAKYNLTSIEIMPTSLEDLFLNHYQSGEIYE
ncbi:ATP-binding cassette domain-containing protein [Mycoplasma sp. P36-A1]|uniref:ABC transporter ATP-binding protein n=1 Tax=Mycoplasma sp. P36-A1 TaxID=3252900 RepID=UPI003C2D5D2A